MFDYIEFVAEYAPFDLYALENVCRAAELHGLSTMIKIDQEPRRFLAQRAVGAGSLSEFRLLQTVRLIHPKLPQSDALWIQCWPVGQEWGIL